MTVRSCPGRGPKAAVDLYPAMPPVCNVVFSIECAGRLPFKGSSKVPLRAPARVYMLLSFTRCGFFESLMVWGFGVFRVRVDAATGSSGCFAW